MNVDIHYILKLLLPIFLIHFCEDPRYNPGKIRFSNAAIQTLYSGSCAGLTARFLAGAFIEKNRKKQHHAVSESKSIIDDLTQFHLELKTIVSWDGRRALTALEQKHFFFLSLYHVWLSTKILY